MDSSDSEKRRVDSNVYAIQVALRTTGIVMNSGGARRRSGYTFNGPQSSSRSSTYLDGFRPRRPNLSSCSISRLGDPLQN